MANRRWRIVLLAIGWCVVCCAPLWPGPANAQTAQPNTRPPELSESQSSQPPAAAPPSTRAPRGPNVVDFAPGDFSSALVSPSLYISPFAAFLSSSAPPSSSNELRAYYQSSSRSRLLNVPEMFGDFRRGGPVLAIQPSTGTLPDLRTEVPLAAGISGLRAAENNHALLGDRVWFAYNYFDAAFDIQTVSGMGLPPQSQSQSLHRSVIAFEKLLDCGATSIEVRMPFGAAFNADGIAGPSAAPAPFGVESESVGNLNVLLKRLLYADDRYAWSAGLGVELPTGSEGLVTYGPISASMEPEAVHLVPFLAGTQQHGRWFTHGFLQLDIASHGDPFRATLNTPADREFVGRINQPVLMGLDLGGGYWLIPPCDCCDGGGSLAVVGEVHYTTPLGNADELQADGGLTAVTINTPVAASYEVLHFTTALQIALDGGWQLRPGVVFPARSERVFDAEYLLQVNRRF